MRKSLPSLVFIASIALGFSGCSRTNTPEQIFGLDRAAEHASQTAGPHAQRARELVEELADTLANSMDDTQRAEDRIRAFLFNYRDEFATNVEGLQEELAHDSLDERRYLAENFSNYMGPSTRRWRQVAAEYSNRNASSWRRIERMLATSMGPVAGQTPAVDIQVPARATSTDMDDVRD